MFDFSIITSWIHQTLTSVMPEGLAVFIECVVIGVCIVALYAILAILLIYMERKVCGFFQCRLGPNRVGKWGSIQVLCDVLKMLTKEIIELKHSDKFLYNLAPFMVIIASFLTFSCLPISKGLEVLDFNVGVFFLLAASSIGVVGILLAGWGSNNKFSLIGAMRSGAQIISYELSVGLSILTMVVLMGTILIYMERKVCGFFQCRLGPNRVGKWGSIQVLCDVLKMLTKEIIELKHSDKFLYNLAPFMVIIASFLTFSCLPISKGLEVLDFNVGVFFLLAASSIGVVGILLAGWGSNNKFSLIGAMRSGAQIISYELSVGLSILTMVVLMGTMQFSEIVESQANGWFIFKGHIPALIAFVIYLIAGNAECNRGPFDLPEAESELTAGYHTEYSGMHFGFFYLAEYLNMFIVAAVAATIFLGGWMPLHIIGLDGFNAVMDYIPGFIWFFGKAFFVVFLLMWIKWTFPRLRIDQILNLEWKYLVPISMVNLVIMVLIVVFGLHF